MSVLGVLCNCDIACNESAAAFSQKSIPLNRIACVAHLLCDDRFIACLIPLSDSATARSAASRPSELDQMKATGKTIVTTIYGEVHKSYKTWIMDSENPFINGHQFEDDLNPTQPKKAMFKDGDAIRDLVKSTVLKVETTMKKSRTKWAPFQW
jgi:hypothetical protein